MKHPASDTPELLINEPQRDDRTIVLAHGAGAAMDTEFMDAFAVGLANLGLRVVRFEFPYMAARRISGKRRPPDREPILRDTWHRVVDSIGADRVVIGGKSMGGRIASLIADEAQVAGLVCLGYPFHPTGKPDKLRIEHLKAIETHLASRWTTILPKRLRASRSSWTPCESRVGRCDGGSNYNRVR